MNKSKIIHVLDYGLGNIGSIMNMLKYIGCEAKAVKNPNELIESSGIILPGVGNFDRGMTYLNKTGMTSALQEIANIKKIPILGICLGMQLMCKSSEEGEMPGLGFIDAHVRRFKFNHGADLKIPHMGWNEVKIIKDGTVLGGPDILISRYYFVHSYYVDCNVRNDVVGITKYDNDFVSAFQVDNLTGVQFHPEKSHKYGMNLLRNFTGSNQ